MAENVIKNKKPKPTKNSESWIWRSVGDWFSLERVIGKEFPVQYLDRALFLMIVGLLMVGVRINAERQVRQIRKMREEVNHQKARYVILRASYMKNGKQSEIAPKLAPLGISESKVAPQKIVVKEAE